MSIEINDVLSLLIKYAMGIRSRESALTFIQQHKDDASAVNLISSFFSIDDSQVNDGLKTMQHLESLTLKQLQKEINETTEDNISNIIEIAKTNPIIKTKLFKLHDNKVSRLQNHPKLIFLFFDDYITRNSRLMYELRSEMNQLRIELRNVSSERRRNELHADQMRLQHQTRQMINTFKQININVDNDTVSVGSGGGDAVTKVVKPVESGSKSLEDSPREKEKKEARGRSITKVNKLVDS